MTFVHQTPIRPETLPEAGHAALSDAVRAYDETLTAMQSGQDYASQLSAALASAQDGKGGETEAMAALRRHMVQDLRRNADSASATLARGLLLRPLARVAEQRAHTLDVARLDHLAV